MVLFDCDLPSYERKHSSALFILSCKYVWKTFDAFQELLIKIAFVIPAAEKQF